MEAETAPAETKARPRYGWGHCPECGAKFALTHHRQVFCTPAHKSAYFAREKVRGQKIAGVALAWRLGRNTSKPALRRVSSDAMADLCRLLDMFAAEDHAAGRPNGLEVLYRRQKAMGIAQ